MSVEKIISRIKEKVSDPYLYAIVLNASLIISFFIALLFVVESNFRIINFILFLFGILTIIYSLGIIAYDGINKRRFGTYLAIAGFILILLGALEFIVAILGGVVGYLGMIIVGSGRKEIETVKKLLWISITGLFLIVLAYILVALYSVSYTNYISIVLIGTVLFVMGVSLSVIKEKVHRNRKYIVFFYSVMIYYVLIAIPMHEGIGIISNFYYGLYDLSLVLISVVSFTVLALLYLYLLYNEKSSYEIERKRGIKFLERGDFKNALACFDRMQSYINSVESYNGKAICLISLGRVKEAIKILEEALRLYPDEPSLINNYANALLISDDIEGAMSNYKKALKINEKYIHAWNNLGRIYMIRGKFEDAKKCFLKAREINPKSEMANRSLKELEELSKEALNLSI